MCVESIDFVFLYDFFNQIFKLFWQCSIFSFSFLLIPLWTAKIFQLKMGLKEKTTLVCLYHHVIIWSFFYQIISVWWKSRIPHVAIVQLSLCGPFFVFCFAHFYVVKVKNTTCGSYRYIYLRVAYIFLYSLISVWWKSRI